VILRDNKKGTVSTNVKGTTYRDNNNKVWTEIQITIFFRVTKFFVIETGDTLSSELVLNFWIRNY
jgi:hypothetical protein